VSIDCGIAFYLSRTLYLPRASSKHGTGRWFFRFNGIGAAATLMRLSRKNMERRDGNDNIFRMVAARLAAGEGESMAYRRDNGRNDSGRDMAAS